MKFIALVSGGKDSCYSILHSIRQGHELVALGNLYPADESQQELDSFMFQTVGHNIVNMYEKCTGLPLFRHAIRPKTSRNVALHYYPTDEDEIEDLLELLKEAKRKMPEIEAVNAGAILSSYQRTRVEDVCSRLGLVALSYLWQRDQQQLMTEMCGMSKLPGEERSPKMDARIIKTAAVGLDDRHLGKSLPEVFPALQKLNQLYDVHICGEGGEFETMVFDAPFFFNGYLAPKVIQIEGRESSDGVFSSLMGATYVERPNKLTMSKMLENLPVPPPLEESWMEMLKEMSTIGFETNDNAIDSSTQPSSLYFPETSKNRVGNLLYVSNITPRKGSTVKEKAQNILDELGTLLADQKVSPSQIMASSLLLSDMSDFHQVNEIYSAFFQVKHVGPLPPARACVGSSLIGEKNSLQLSVVIDLASQLDTVHTMTLNKSKGGLHVQGRSYWAPCNIGPYSQAIWNANDANKISFISGQIALIPSSMQLAESLKTGASQYVSQSVLSLRHFDTLKQTIGSQKQISMVCYVSQKYMASIVARTWSLYCKELASKSEHWFHRELADPRNLIIAKVSSLPKDALCEWGGVTCSRFVTEEDDEDTIPFSSIKEDSGNEFKATVRGNGDTRCYKTLYVDSKDELNKFFKNQGHSQVTLFCQPSNQVLHAKNVEFVPVEKVYDYKGKERLAGLFVMY
ncbi:diphthine--ammonia ligase [Lachancea thermotolerans CBS 6340]|uniref:Diphthine--ammonia ligase n=1 Tax=Lachancea thermotolerans (strain ATCC 56472 / CBS 6340 / NRRL Y-8284) TaxID=559295 RepID=C5DMU0_LACTC|nr:KLTH0G11594p [Lachancea thermotolerans CBS 6340]CAR25101.1 KLTH0G11594p [Lachancea thermotolerans CBS 6340]